MEGIYTPRLILTTLDENAAGDVLDFYLENPEFEDFEPQRPYNFYTYEQMAKTLKYEKDVMKRSLGMRYWIFEQESPYKIIGTVSFQNFLISVYHSCQIGYKIHKDYQKMGYATEAVRAACEEIFEEFDIHRIEALTMPVNEPSKKVLKKAGFLYEGLAREKALIKNVWEDHEVYSLIKSDIL